MVVDAWPFCLKSGRLQIILIFIVVGFLNKHKLMLWLLGGMEPGTLTKGYSTVDLLVLISWYQLLLIKQLLFTFLQNQAALMRRSTVLSLPLQLVFPGWSYQQSVHLNMKSMILLLKSSYTKTFFHYSLSPGVSRSSWTQTLDYRMLRLVFYHWATAASIHTLKQDSLTEGEGSVQLTTLYWLVQISCF